MENYKVGMFFTRKFKISEAGPPVDVKEAFARFTDGGTSMTVDQLLRFLVEFQGQSEAKIADAEQIMERIVQQRHHIANSTGRALGIDDFHHFLFCDDLNAPIGSQVHQDMAAPLSHYFIYTGHNSYLTGNQLSSDCSDVPIRKALMRGVRVIELDIWPNSSKDDVDVLHGRTLTTPVTLIECLRSIKQYAFSTSPYPVIVTLEDHLTPDLQERVAEMVSQTFGDMLFYPESECLEDFPSAESLKYRIILSTKPPKEYLEAKNIKDKAKESQEEERWGKDIMEPKEELETDDKSDNDQSEDSPDDEDADDCDNKPRRLGQPEYKRLIGIHAKKYKGELSESLKIDSGKVGRLSLSEPKLEKATETHGSEIVRFTQRNILRVYPKGTRFNSSNYNPLIAWSHGAQMVAFNMQGHGRSLWLMQGMFRANGGCGYVKKPDLLIKADFNNKVFNPNANLPVKKTLKVTLYMGDGWRLDFSPTHFDSFSPPDFYARIGIAGVPADVVMKQTKTLEDDWVPVWNEEFHFPLTVPELALLRIEVHEYDRSEKDDFGGQTCLPVWELRPGIRAVPLCDRKGEKFKSVKLLMRFEFV